MRWPGLLPLVLVLFLPTPLRAADPEADGGPAIAYDHKGQFGAHMQFGTGYRVILPYEAAPRVYCGQTEPDGDFKKVCTGRSPFFLEAGASYGITSSLELLADVRIGLETDFRPSVVVGSDPRALVLAPGVKIFIDDEGSTKFFSTLQLAIDF